jgi:ADP-ribose pyrophosphatase YjhB (NUDIX family)
MKLPNWLGNVVFILGWPIVWLALYNSRRAYLMIVINDEVLVLKSWLAYKRQWRLPGGGIRVNEQPIDSVKRELKEELNINIQPGKCELIVENQKSQKYNYNFYVYKYIVNNKPDIKLDYENINYAWISINKLKPQDIADELGAALKTC